MEFDDDSVLYQNVDLDAIEKKAAKPKPAVSSKQNTENKKWQCPQCTLMNDMSNSRCQVCRGPAPQLVQMQGIRQTKCCIGC